MRNTLGTNCCSSLSETVFDGLPGPPLLAFAAVSTVICPIFFVHAASFSVLLVSVRFVQRTRPFRLPCAPGCQCLLTVKEIALVCVLW
jgi:hypothetical protein